MEHLSWALESSQEAGEATPLAPHGVAKFRRGGGGAGVMSAEAPQAGWAGHVVGAPETRFRRENRSSNGADWKMGEKVCFGE